jgi:hypothetical protein
MAERRGGYRKPKKGAQVSPPGALSKRKERENVKNSRQGVMGAGGYGSTKEARELASSAPFAGKTPSPQFNIPSSPGVGPQGRLPALGEPTERPMESPEIGMPFGEGPGPADLGLMPGAGMNESPQKEDLRKLAQYMPAIELAANAEGAPATLRTFVKYLKGIGNSGESGPKATF